MIGPLDGGNRNTVLGIRIGQRRLTAAVPPQPARPDWQIALLDHYTSHGRRGTSTGPAPKSLTWLCSQTQSVQVTVHTQTISMSRNQQLRQGRPLAEAVCAARAGLAADPGADATGWSFITIGGA